MNPSAWVTFPSATTEKASQAIESWRSMGWKTCVFYDEGKPTTPADLVLVGQFKGYYRVINTLAKACLYDGNADVVCLAGDDMRPPMGISGPEIAAMYLERFPDGFGVLQCTGDRQGMDSNGVPAAARICGSPIMGKGWIDRAYGGRGPCWDGYHSFYADEDLWNVAKLLNVLWLEPSLNLVHLHWSFGWVPQMPYQRRNSMGYWSLDKQLFEDRKAQGFPCYQPL